MDEHIGQLSSHKVSSWSQNILPETTYGLFGYETNVEFVDSKDDKRPRYPLEINLPFEFDTSEDRNKIVDLCVGEFYKNIKN